MQLKVLVWEPQDLLLADDDVLFHQDLQWALRQFTVEYEVTGMWIATYVSEASTRRRWFGEVVEAEFLHEQGKDWMWDWHANECSGCSNAVAVFKTLNLPCSHHSYGYKVLVMTERRFQIQAAKMHVTCRCYLRDKVRFSKHLRGVWSRVLAPLSSPIGRKRRGWSRMQ